MVGFYQNDYSYGSSSDPFPSKPVVMTRIDVPLRYNWPDNASPKIIAGNVPLPNHRINANNFAVRWLGQVRSLFQIENQLTTRTDDGSRIYFNNLLTIDDWQIHPPVTTSTYIDLGTLQGVW